MSRDYYTIRTAGSGELVEKKSRFLATALHVSSDAEVQAALEAEKKRYYDARHHCYARVFGETGMDVRSSDAGEPSGTAGRPILDVLKGYVPDQDPPGLVPPGGLSGALKGLTDCMVVVTRYFGGTLLGTGGLMRAYSGAAKAALKNAEIVRMCRCEVFTASVEYSLFDRIQYLMNKQGVVPDDVVYTDRVTLHITIPEARSPEIKKSIMNAADGRALIREIACEYRGIPVSGAVQRDL